MRASLSSLVNFIAFSDAVIDKILPCYVGKKCTAKRNLLLGRLNHILELNVEIDDFQSKLQEAVNRKDTQKR